jgi:hypothetical protein
MLFAHFSSRIRSLMAGCITLALVGVVSAPFVAHAQFQGVSLSNPSDLGSVFSGSVDDTFQDIETGVGNAVNDGVANLGGGNPIAQGAAQGAAGGIAGALTCAIGGIGATVANSFNAVPVSDRVTNAATMAQTEKECTLDAIAFALKEGIIKGILQGMVTYINNGFSGGPGYLQDEGQYFDTMQDRQFDEFLNNPNNFSSLCSAWEADVRLAIATEYTTATRGTRPAQLSGTGTGLGSAIDGSNPDTCEILSDGYAESGEDRTGFWSRFETQTTNTDGNPVSSYFDITEQFAQNFEYNVQRELRELQRNEGFFDVTYCDDGSDFYSSLPGSENTVGSQSCKVTTPGSVINEQLNQALGSDQRRLELADEINEVFSALVGQLINSVFSELGLFGTTQRTGGSQSLIDQYAGETDTLQLAASRADLINQLNEYETAVTEYIGIKERSASALLDAREVVFNSMACYESKYNTWGRIASVGTSNYVIDPEQVEDVPEEDRERVVFTTSTQVGEGVVDTNVFLTPEQTQQQLDGYMQLLDRVNGYIIELVDDIDRAELNIDQAREYKAQLQYLEQSENPVDAAVASSSIVQLITEIYGTGGNTVTIELEDGSFAEVPQDLSEATLLEVYSAAVQGMDVFDNEAATQQATGVERATQDMLEGVQLQNGGRAPGVLDDLAQCQTFDTVYNNSNVEDTENTDQN